MTTTVEPQVTRQTFTDAERRMTLLGLMIVFLLSALDQNIVSTAMPRIVAQLQGLNLYAWVTTAYLLSSTVMVPIYGKLSDIYGRKPILVIGITTFMVGSTLCGMAGEFGPLPILGGGMVQLIVFRALQGLGGAALITSSFAIIADLFPPRERGKLGGIFAAAFGLASVIGPVAGGFLTDLPPAHVFGLVIAGWRWVFYVNLPLAGLSLFIILARMPKLMHRTGGRIDFPGAALLLVTFIPLLLALSWAGRDYARTSPTIVGLFAVSAVGLLSFLWVEHRAVNPIVSLALFRNRTFSAANASGFLGFMGFMGLVAFLPLYMQLGQGVSATTSGLTMLPLTVGLILTAIVSGQVVARTGKYMPLLIGGSALFIVGAVLLLQVTPHTTPLDVAWRGLILGLGFGPSQSLFNLAVQNAVQPSEIGVATSAGQFFRQIGQTIGVAVFGAILTQGLQAESARAPHAPGAVVRPLNLADLERAAVQQQVAGRHAGAHRADPVMAGIVTAAVRHTILGGVVIAVFAFITTLLVPALPLRGGVKAEAMGEAPAEDLLETEPALETGRGASA